MAHNIMLDEKFYTSRDKPAWHQLGRVNFEGVDRTAREAVELIGGTYDVVKRPLFFEDGTQLPSHVAVVRGPVQKDENERVFGIVSPDYSLITPDDFVDVWDEHVKAPVDTLGMLGHGDQQFISGRFTSYDVKGSEVVEYGLAINAMNGRQSARFVRTPVMTVCQNTMNAAEKAATETYILVHNAELKEKLGEWLGDMWDQWHKKADLLKEFFELMADKQVDDEGAAGYFLDVYPEPKDPGLNGPRELVERRIANHEYWRKRQIDRRNVVMTLFQGVGTGMDAKATQGTMFGAYNAVCEFEDYRKWSHDEAASMQSLLVGERARTKTKAFELAVNLSR